MIWPEIDGSNAPKSYGSDGNFAVEMERRPNARTGEDDARRASRSIRLKLALMKLESLVIAK
uniref:Uncharacterized protein n=1 Tax=Hyaloperonospora arabidopsidis (strain Emoy2) TaxID=559515 RepID=M4BFE0_HYAAE